MCPARVAYHNHRRFFGSAAAAERAGYRPCLRCRPELAPGCALVDAIPRLAHAAAHRIAAGALNGHSVADLASELGVSERHLRRALERELGVSPVALAQTHRLLLAKRLLADTTLSVTRVAYASGFQSLRRFNATFRAQYRMPPSILRRPSRAEPADDYLRLTLAYRAPLAWDVLIACLARDAVGGVEFVEGGRYGRTISIEGRSGFVFAENAATRTHVNVAISPSLVPVLMPLLARMRRLFDLDAEPTVIDAHLAQGGLGALVAQRPGVRIPGAVDGFDVALRVLLRGRARIGRVGNAGTSSKDPACRVASALGERIETGIMTLTRLAPSAARVAEAGSARLEALGIPRRRANSAVAVARLVDEGSLLLEPGSDKAATRRALTEIAGVGDQVATTIVIRALYWPDALPAVDRSLQRAAGVSTPSAFLTRAERWRPWRAYAALHLWLQSEVR